MQEFSVKQIFEDRNRYLIGGWHWKEYKPRFSFKVFWHFAISLFGVRLTAQMGDGDAMKERWDLYKDNVMFAQFLISPGEDNTESLYRDIDKGLDEIEAHAKEAFQSI